jgi:hypothetical protein
MCQLTVGVPIYLPLAVQSAIIRAGVSFMVCQKLDELEGEPGHRSFGMDRS